MISVVMCGGKGTRMQKRTEKPLIMLKGIPMVERVISALASSGKFSRIVAAVSPNTPKTKKFLKGRGIEVMETAGEGYPQDLSPLLSVLNPERVMVVPADIPLLGKQSISHIIDITERELEPAISILLDKDFVENLGINPSVVFGRYCHSGITVFDTSKVVVDEIIPERYVIMNKDEIAVNVNTKQEIELAEKLLV